MKQPLKQISIGEGGNSDWTQGYGYQFWLCRHGAFPAAAWSPWRRLFAGIALSGLTAVLFTLAFPPYDVWPLIFVGPVPMILAQHRILPEKASFILADIVSIRCIRYRPNETRDDHLP